MFDLPRHIFFTGAPGSRWSGIAQTLEQMPGMNTTDRTEERTYTHHSYNGHLGAYFGKEMEFNADPKIIETAYEDPEAGCMLIKSHQWCDWVGRIRILYPDVWVILVYRPDLACHTWWHEAGGFQIDYPNYSEYKNSANMLYAIQEINSKLLGIGLTHGSKWEHFTPTWIEENFGCTDNLIKEVFPDILVTIIK